MDRKPPAIEKFRLDAITDGVFGVAMTLLVIDLKLPEGFHPANAHEFIHALADLNGQFVVYVISFIVLSTRWMSVARMSRQVTEIDDKYVVWTLTQLFLITCVPFTTIVVGRYAAFPPAIWLYGIHTIISALVALRIAMLAERHIGHEQLVERRFGIVTLIVSSLLAIGLSFVHPKFAMWVYFLNALAPVVRSRLRKPDVTKQQGPE